MIASRRPVKDYLAAQRCKEGDEETPSPSGQLMRVRHFCSERLHPYHPSSFPLSTLPGRFKLP
jgi:hypothetical protein